MNEPFNLEQFKAGRKAITRDGRIAEFLYHDESLGRPLGAKILGSVFDFHREGLFYLSLGAGDELDLVHMAPIKPEADPLAEIKAAYNSGLTVQHNLCTGDNPHWVDIDYRPEWSDYPKNYRIKPEPKLVPLEAEDIPPVCWVRFENGTDSSWLVHTVWDEGVAFTDSTGRTDRMFFASLDGDGWEYSTDRRVWKKCSKNGEAK
jgi:hypothetical protein